MKKWEGLLRTLLQNRGIKTKKEIEDFLHPPYPPDIPDLPDMSKAVTRIRKAIKHKESIVVYADYDADGITAGAIMWESLHHLGAHVMPYIPHRVEEGYGLSVKGIDAVRAQYDPSLIITVDHGITAWEKVEYAKKMGMDVIVTDHHVKPKKLPDCTIVHTTQLSGAGVSWFLARHVILASESSSASRIPVGSWTSQDDAALLELAAVGTIADMVPLVGPNRSIAKYGLAAINETKRVGLEALIADAGLTKGALDVYAVSHMVAPRLNAMGRIEHAMDALRLLCTKQQSKAALLAQKLGFKNRERQQLTLDTTAHALQGLSLLKQGETLRKLLFVVHESYNPGVIGLVAGKLVEKYYRPAIVVSKGKVYSKASARSINGFNIVEAIRSCSDILVDVGGHPMAAGFTVETKHLKTLQKRLEKLAEQELDEVKLTRTLNIDAEIPLDLVTQEFYQAIQQLQPFGLGNPEPVFMTRMILVKEARLVGEGGKHLKLRISASTHQRINALTPPIDAIAFNQGSLYGKLQSGQPVDLAYTIALDTWNGNSRLQLKIKDIHLQPQSR
ncbi:single-stranded-DNA-specific exonuclease RecJ [Candidatus Gottesmanbacteria bacterium]|nr:single-stranded-DNA-specific exonuclease RecJ [Candidatus Gottesmanbacteria bacterium]